MKQRVSIVAECIRRGRFRPHQMAVTTVVTDMYQASRSLISGAKIIIDSDGIRDHGAVRTRTLPVTVYR